MEMGLLQTTMSEKMVLMPATDSSEKIPCFLSVGVTMLTDDGCSKETEGRLSGSPVSEKPPIRSIRSCKVSHSVGNPKEVAGTGRLSCKKSFFNLSYTRLATYRLVSHVTVFLHEEQEVTRSFPLFLFRRFLLFFQVLICFTDLAAVLKSLCPYRCRWIHSLHLLFLRK